MKWLAIVLGVIAALVLIVVLVGAMLPQSHVAVSSAQFRKPAADLFRTITDVGTAATWRKDVERIEMLPANGNRMAWREVSGNDVVNYEGEIVRPPAPGVSGRFISRITDKNLPYGGEWIIDVSMNGDIVGGDSDGEWRGVQSILSLRVEVRDGPQRHDRRISSGARHACRGRGDAEIVRASVDRSAAILRSDAPDRRRPRPATVSHVHL